MCCLLVKYGLFFSNLIFTLGGLALIGLGVATLLQLTDVLEVVTTNVNAIPITVIVLGALIFLIAFLGCCGAIRENRCFLTLYAICMIALAAAKLYVVVVVFRNLSDIKDLVKEWLEEAFLRLEIREQFYVMQSTFQCCGTTGPNSYNVALPPSCCPSVVQTCEASSAFEGCNKVVADFFETYGEVIGIIVAVIVAIEVLAVILSFSFCSTVGNNRRRTV